MSTDRIGRIEGARGGVQAIRRLQDLRLIGERPRQDQDERQGRRGPEDEDMPGEPVHRPAKRSADAVVPRPVSPVEPGHIDLRA